MAKKKCCCTNFDANSIQIANFVASIRNKAEEVSREMLRFQCWLENPDELESQAIYFEAQSKLLLERAERFRAEIEAKKKCL